jgi:bifunctional DNA-binding transcriptional regulator/antitoxin component of YhaV-PrlF toxin-antitoxin module
MITTVVLRKKRQITIPRHLCEKLEVGEEDLLTIDIQKVIRKDKEKVADE